MVNDSVAASPKYTLPLQALIYNIACVT